LPLFILGDGCAGEVQSVTLKLECPVLLVWSSASSLKKKNWLHDWHSYTLDSNMYMEIEMRVVDIRKS
jgi:hypothetical protein